MAERQSTLSFGDEQSQLKSGIYQIRHIESGRVYIGSAIDIRNRWHIHRTGLRAKRHHSIHLQRAWDKYGERAFAFEVIAFVPREQLLEREQHFLDFANSSDRRFGFNICPKAGSTLGINLSDETKRKLSEAHTGMVKPFVAEANRTRVVTDETRAKHAESRRRRNKDEVFKAKVAAALATPEVRARMSEAQLGRLHSEETRAKMSAAQKGRTFSAETIVKMKEAAKGRVFTPEHRQALSEGQRGRVHTEETRAKISAANKGMASNNRGKKFSEETKQKMREAWVRRRAKAQSSGGVLGGLLTFEDSDASEEQ